MTADAASTLDELADDFAGRLTSLMRGVLGEDTPRFHAANAGSNIRVSPMTDNKRLQRIPVRINGEVRLFLLVQYFCCWDGHSQFLAADRADFHVFFAGSADPLLRFEYLRGGTDPPGAHIQVHAHRDEIAYLLRLADRKGKPQQKLRADKIPRLAEMHLPVGGHRFRPSLEDVLLLLEREFAIDTAPGWRKVIDTNLREWRLTQLKAAVRDAPEAAAEVMRTLGYEVVPPKVVGPRAPADDSKLFLP